MATGGSDPPGDEPPENVGPWADEDDLFEEIRKAGGMEKLYEKKYPWYKDRFKTNRASTPVLGKAAPPSEDSASSGSSGSLFKRTSSSDRSAGYETPEEMRVRYNPRETWLDSSFRRRQETAEISRAWDSCTGPDRMKQFKERYAHLLNPEGAEGTRAADVSFHFPTRTEPLPELQLDGRQLFEDDSFFNNPSFQTSTTSSSSSDMMMDPGPERTPGSLLPRGVYGSGSSMERPPRVRYPEYQGPKIVETPKGRPRLEQRRGTMERLRQRIDMEEIEAQIDEMLHLAMDDDSPGARARRRDSTASQGSVETFYSARSQFVDDTPVDTPDGQRTFDTTGSSGVHMGETSGSTMADTSGEVADSSGTGMEADRRYFRNGQPMNALEMEDRLKRCYQKLVNQPIQTWMSTNRKLRRSLSLTVPQYKQFVEFLHRRSPALEERLMWMEDIMQEPVPNHDDRIPADYHFQRPQQLLLRRWYQLSPQRSRFLLKSDHRDSSKMERDKIHGGNPEKQFQQILVWWECYHEKNGIFDQAFNEPLSTTEK